MSPFDFPRENRPQSIVDAFRSLRDALFRAVNPERPNEGQVRELNRSFFLATFAGMEGLLRHDMERRLVSDDRDLITDRLKALRKKTTSTDYVSLEDILKEWKEATGKGEVIGGFAQHKSVRDWLAHGRCGPLPTNSRVAPERLLDDLLRIRALLPQWPSPS